MSCEFGYIDCENEGMKCYLCSNALHYQQKKQRSYTGLKKTVKANTKRMGSSSEVKNHEQNKKMLTAITSGTPNSGAGLVKGDEQIRGLINVMEEIKTTTAKNLNKKPGKETFTIQRAWMDKLEAEAKEANMEFNYLKFSFDQYDDKFYVISNADVFMDMVATMYHDRLQIKIVEMSAEISEKSRKLTEAENIKLRAEIDFLKSELKAKEMKDDQL